MICDDFELRDDLRQRSVPKMVEKTKKNCHAEEKTVANNKRKMKRTSHIYTKQSSPTAKGAIWREALPEWEVLEPQALPTRSTRPPSHSWGRAAGSVQPEAFHVT